MNEIMMLKYLIMNKQKKPVDRLYSNNNNNNKK